MTRINNLFGKKWVFSDLAHLVRAKCGHEPAGRERPFPLAWAEWDQEMPKKQENVPLLAMADERNYHQTWRNVGLIFMSFPIFSPQGGIR